MICQGQNSEFKTLFSLRNLKVTYQYRIQCCHFKSDVILIFTCFTYFSFLGAFYFLSPGVLKFHRDGSRCESFKITLLLSLSV